MIQALRLKHLDSLQSLCLVACDSEVTAGAVQKDDNLKQPEQPKEQMNSWKLKNKESKKATDTKDITKFA